MLKREFGLNTACLAAMFLIGNAAVTIPFSGADRSAALCFIAAFLLSLPIAFALAWVLNRAKAPKSKAGKFLYAAFKLAAVSFLIVSAAASLKDYSDFVSLKMLPGVSRYLIFVILAGIAGFIACQSLEVMLKFSLFAFFLTAIIIAALFIAALPRLNFDTVILLRMPDKSSFLMQLREYFSRVFLSAFPIFLYERIAFRRVTFRRCISGFSIGAAVLLVCMLSSIMLFGPGLAGELSFPYAAAVSTVTVGNLFTRMDGAAYFVYFAGCHIKLALSIFCGYTLLNSLGAKSKKAACLFCSIALLAAACF